MVAADYKSFIDSRRQSGINAGFEPLWIPDFQKYLVMQVFLPYAAQPGRPSFYEVLKADGYRALPGLPAPKESDSDA